MDGVAGEQRKRLETIQSELADVRRRLDRLYDLVETTDMEINDFRPRIRDHRERQERLEAAEAEARASLGQRRKVLEQVETITAYAQDMSRFLKKSGLTERRTFIESFVKEIVVTPDNALMRYTVPMPEDSLAPGMSAEDMALNGSVLSTVPVGGAGGTRTPYLFNAIEALSQLSYSPTEWSGKDESEYTRQLGRVATWGVGKRVWSRWHRPVVGAVREPPLRSNNDGQRGM